MRHLTRIFSLLMVIMLPQSGFAAGADGEDISFVCPCTISSTNGTTATLTLGAKNITTSATSALTVEVYAHTGIAVTDDSPFLTDATLGTVVASSTLAAQGYSVDLQSLAAGNYYLTAYLIADNEIKDQLRMADQVSVNSSFSTEKIDLLTDTDGDGVADFNEKLEGTDPNSAASKPGTTTIDIMALYDNSLPTEYSNDHIARIDHIVTVSNTALSDSKVDMKIRVVNYQNIDSSKNFENMLNAVNDSTDEYANLSSLRDQHGADLISVLTARDDSPTPSCGVATFGGAGSNSVAMEGAMNPAVHVNVNDVRFDGCDDMTVLHEIGHNMGLGHSAAQNETGTFIWARGYGLNDRFHTVMAYGSAFNEPQQVQVVSTPDISVCDNTACGVPINEATPASAAKALDAVRFQVSRYKDSGLTGGGSSPADSSSTTSSSDTDEDGIPNVFETVIGSDPGTADADGDADNDGQTNLEEFNALPGATQYLQTTSSSANITSIHIINTSDSAQSFTGSLYIGDGSRQGSLNTLLSTSSVPSKGRLILKSSDLETLFGVSAWRGPAMLVVKGAGSFEMMAKLISPSRLTSNTNCVREDRVLNIEGFDKTDRTFVRFINTTDSSLGSITGTLYNAQGQVIGEANTTFVDSLAARSQVWVNRTQFGEKVGAEWDGEAMLEVNQKAGLKLLNLNFVNSETFFNFTCFESSDSSSRVYLQTTSTSANISYTHIVNTSDVAQSFTGTLYNGDGERLGEANQPLHEGTVASKGRVIISSDDLETAFGASAWRGPAIVEVSGSNKFELMTKLTSPSNLISNTNCVRTNQVHNIEGADSSDRTFVRFINQGDTTMTNIRGTLYDKDGNVIGNANQVMVESLAPNAAVWVNRDEFADKVNDTWNGEATLIVDTISDLRLLNLNFVNSETFFNFSCYEVAE